jgi:hypothetical protein
MFLLILHYENVARNYASQNSFCTMQYHFHIDLLIEFSQHANVNEPFPPALLKKW